MQQQLLKGVRCEHAFKPASAIPLPRSRRHVCVCKASTKPWLATRRQLLENSTMLAAAMALVQPNAAYAGLDRYVKRKKLDPLDTYVPLVLEARDRLAGMDSVMVESPTTARQLMRSGPFSGLRDNIRALGQYAATPAEEGGSGIPEKDASALVSEFFRTLEDYDLVLYNAVREAKAAQEKQDKAYKDKKDGEDGSAAAVEVDPAIGLDKEAAQEKLAAAVTALDKLIATVPAGVLAKSREVLEKVSSKQAAAAAAAAAAAVNDA